MTDLEELLFGALEQPPPAWWRDVAPDLSAPFPWFGGKSRAASLVWERLGEVVNYVEPFAGSLAVLLGRPHAPTIETVNDLDGHIANFWRSIQRDPGAVAEAADWPVNEIDLHARHRYLTKLRGKLAARLLADPDFYQPRIAGWWVWGLCAWIGGGWCNDYGLRKDGTPKRPTPNLHGANGHGKGVHARSSRLPALSGSNGGGAEVGVHRRSMRLPMLGAGSGGENDHACAHHGRGVHGAGMRSAGQLPVLTREGQGIGALSRRSRLPEVFSALATRLRYTRVTCGDFERILSPAVTWRHGLTGVFLDPPYPADAGSTGGIYTSTREERAVFDRAFRWALDNGHRKDLRIAFCYYEGTGVGPAQGEGPAEDVSHAFCSAGWDVVSWKAAGGYGGQSGEGNENARRERIAFSPACLRARQGSLFG